MTFWPAGTLSKACCGDACVLAVVHCGDGGGASELQYSVFEVVATCTEVKSQDGRFKTLSVSDGSIVD